MLDLKKEEPNFFTDIKKKIKNPKQSDAWGEISNIRADLKKHILVTEQSSMCAYCEKMVKDDSTKSLIDHFKVRDHFPDLTLEYTNLFVDCGYKNHCSSIKDQIGLKKEDYSKLISPLDNIEENFSYTMFGEIEGLNENAKFTQECFALNCISLTQERKTIIKNFEAYKEFDNETLSKYLGGHINFIKYLKECA